MCCIYSFWKEWSLGWNRTLLLIRWRGSFLWATAHLSDKVLSCEDIALHGVPLLFAGKYYLKGIYQTFFITKLEPSQGRRFEPVLAAVYEALSHSDVASDWHQLICSAIGPWPTLHPMLSCTLHGENGVLSPFLLRCPDVPGIRKQSLCAISPSSSSHHTVWGR